MGYEVATVLVCDGCGRLIPHHSHTCFFVIDITGNYYFCNENCYDMWPLSSVVKLEPLGSGTGKARGVTFITDEDDGRIDPL